MPPKEAIVAFVCTDIVGNSSVQLKKAKCSKFWFRVYLCDVVSLEMRGWFRSAHSEWELQLPKPIDGDEIEERCRRAECIMVLAIGLNQAAMQIASLRSIPATKAHFWQKRTAEKNA